MPFRKDFIKEYKKASVKLKFFLQSPKRNDITYYKNLGFFEGHYGIDIAQTDRQTDRQTDLRTYKKRILV